MLEVEINNEYRLVSAPLRRAGPRFPWKVRKRLCTCLVSLLCAYLRGEKTRGFVLWRGINTLYLYIISMDFIHLCSLEFFLAFCWRFLSVFVLVSCPGGKVPARWPVLLCRQTIEETPCPLWYNNTSIQLPYQFLTLSKDTIHIYSFPNKIIINVLYTRCNI